MSVERPAEEMAESPTSGFRTPSRSPVLDQFRQSPFRVLQLPIDATAEEAVWKAEDAMVLIGAGLPASGDDPLPWLPEPDEHEVRQAVQWIEEPLRRLVEECFWFDFAADPGGEDLRRGLIGPDARLLSDYLGRDGSDASITARRNRANACLLLAALSMNDAMPEGMNGDASAPASPRLAWANDSGLRVAGGDGALDFGKATREAKLESCRAAWTDALGRWGRLLADPEFLDHLREMVARLNDELVGEDDVEVVLSGTRSRLIDLVSGELKRQVLEGRSDRLRAVLGVIDSSAIEPNQWSMALRPLRHLFRAEIAELDVLIEEPETLSPDDVSVYLGRLGALVRRWGEIDSSGVLGLTEIADESVRKLDALIGQREDFDAIERTQELLTQAESIASAESVKQKIRSHSEQTASRIRWACHFCDKREMDAEKSVVLRGQKETGRTHGYNSTTIHYGVRFELVQRCETCAHMHQYIRSMGTASRFALILPLLAIGYALHYHFKALWNDSVGVLMLFAFISAALIAAIAPIVRWGLAFALTPKGDRKYWNVKSSRQYKSLKDEWYSITTDSRTNALELAQTNR